MAKKIKKFNELKKGDKVYSFYSDCLEIVECIVENTPEDGIINTKTKNCGYELSFDVRNLDTDTYYNVEGDNLWNLFCEVLSTDKDVLKETFIREQKVVLDGIKNKLIDINVL